MSFKEESLVIHDLVASQLIKFRVLTHRSTKGPCDQNWTILFCTQVLCLRKSF